METKEKENILPDTEGMSGENNISGEKNVKKKLSKPPLGLYVAN